MKKKTRREFKPPHLSLSSLSLSLLESNQARFFLNYLRPSLSNHSPPHPHPPCCRRGCDFDAINSNHTHLARRGRLREQHASDRLGGSRELLHQDPEGWLDWKERGVKRECENQGGGESVRAAGTGVGEKEKKKQWKQSSSSSIWRLFSRLNPLTGPAGARVVEQRSSWLFKEENGGLVRREERCLWRRSLFFPLEFLRSDEV